MRLRTSPKDERREMALAHKRTAAVAAHREPPWSEEAGPRLQSLDALRGFDMFWIIGGGEVVKGLAKAIDTPVLNAFVPQLEHVRWRGLHCWDVIWPLFMFIVGVAIPLSIARRRAAGMSSGRLLLHALWRAGILFGLGTITQGNLLAWDLSVFRPCYSVLHGIAAGYLIAMVVAVTLRPKQQVAVTAGFLLLYWALMTLVPVPGVGPGVLTPEGNLATFVDRAVLGRFHYGENTWFLSYLGFASSVLLGSFAGQLLNSARPPKNQILLLISAGLTCIAVGAIWSFVFPIIKLLWTSSFVLVCGGLSLLALALFYWIIDVRGYRRWAFFFVVIGMNSLAAYLATMLLDFRAIADIFVGKLLPRLGPWDRFTEALLSLVVIWSILLWMYRTKSFVKI
jgi:predicted acyltransferase